jgi:hypothetical protein
MLELIGRWFGVLLENTASFAAFLGNARDYILLHFGQNGLYAAYIAGGVLGIVIVYRVVKITLLAIKYVVVPSLVLAFLASLVLPYSFAAALPVTLTFCSLFLLVKA